MSMEQTIQAARRVLNLDLLPARLGDGTGTVYDLSTPGHYYVRKLEANGNLSKAFSLPANPLASIPPKDGLPVSIGYLLNGTQCIYQADPIAMQSANVSPYALNPLDTAVYGKTSQTNLATLYYQRHADTVNFPFTIIVFKAPVIINGVADFFAGSSISVSAFVPTSGFKCYVCVFLRSDMTLEAFASTPINTADPLTVARDVQECITQSSANSVIICAWELTGGDTVLSTNPAKNVDMRQIINTSSGGLSSGVATIVAGTGISVDATDPANPIVSSTVVGGAGDYILLRDQKAQNTQGGTFTSGAWRTRDLNLEAVDTGGHCGLSANQFTLDTGTYRITARCPAHYVGSHQARLYNITDSAVQQDTNGNDILGTSEYTAGSPALTSYVTNSTIMSRFTIASSKTFEIQHRCLATESTDGFGVAANFAAEVYTVVELIKE